MTWCQMINIKTFPCVLCCCCAVDHNTLQEHALAAGPIAGTCARTHPHPHTRALPHGIFLAVFWHSQLWMGLLCIQTIRLHRTMWERGSLHQLCRRAYVRDPEPVPTVYVRDPEPVPMAMCVILGLFPRYTCVILLAFPWRMCMILCVFPRHTCMILHPCSWLAAHIGRELWDCKSGILRYPFIVGSLVQN